jgi:AbrB family looped-hinge helix DNA binding protein
MSRDKDVKVKTTMGHGGRVVIPSAMRRRLNLKAGEAINVSLESDGIVITTPAMALRRLQKRFAEAVPASVSLADELIAERRKEAENE